MSDLLRFSGPTAPGFLVVMVGLFVVGAFVLWLVALRYPTQPRWNDPASQRWRDEHREDGR